MCTNWDWLDLAPSSDAAVIQSKPFHWSSLICSLSVGYGDWVWRWSWWILSLSSTFSYHMYISPTLIDVIFSYKFGFFLFWLHYIFQDECKKPEFSEMRGRGGPGPPKGVIEKNLNVPKTPLSPNFWLKISTLSSLKLFISFPNTYFDFFIFSFLPPKNRFLGFKFFSKKPKNLKKSILPPKSNFSMK